jgi:hypothetical protein
MTETESARSKLRDLAESRLSLYVREMGEDFYAKLIAAKANWRAGYLPAHDVFAVFPQTGKGQIVVGPFTVVKWKDEELLDRGVPSADLSALMREAAETGFEQWANEAPAAKVVAIVGGEGIEGHTLDGRRVEC